MKKWIASTAIAAALITAPVQAFAQLGDHTLKPGMSNTEVRSLQSVLKAKGTFNYTGTFTTYFGTYTTSAVKSLERAKGLTPDGIADRPFYNAINVYGTVNTSSLITNAKRYMGTPYVWGGTSPSGFDCSGFIYYLFQKTQNMDLPRTAAGMFSLAGSRVSSLIPGDLVFFETYTTGASHVGIYIGNGQFINAASNGVTISSLNNSYWKPRYLGAKRL